nr:THO complex subunit 2-like [Biomphalaria glabrata]
MNISLWLQSLANFAGAICHKYQVELTGILQYVANQLKAGKSIDLLLLREVVQKMAGVEISEKVTYDQLEAMAGGELVRQEQRDSTVFAEDVNKHLKLVGKLYDQVKYDELKKLKDKKNHKTICYINAYKEVMGPVVEAIKPVFSSKIWDDLTPQFYITFWSLSMYDLYVPKGAYEKQIFCRKIKSVQWKLTKTCLSLFESQALYLSVTLFSLSLFESQARYLSVTLFSLSLFESQPVSKKRKEQERCKILTDRLKDEARRQVEHVQRLMERLEEEKHSWFPTGTLKSEMTTNLLQYCLFPHCCFTASDAIYCGHFIQVLHNLKTPNFSTLITYDRVFNDITYTVTSCTDNEA